MSRRSSLRVSRSQGRAALIVGLVMILIVAGAGAAFAFFSATTDINASGTGGTLAVPTGVASNGAATSNSVPIKWTAPAGYTATGYSVLRCTGSGCTPSTAIASGTCSSGSIGTAVQCTDTDPALTANTTYNYAVKGKLNNWTSAASTAFQTATAAAATKLAFTTQPSTNQNIQATGTQSFNVDVAVQDSGGTTQTSDNTTTVTLAINNNAGPGGVLTCTNGGGLGPVTVASGVAHFTGCAITKTGTGYTLTASSTPSLTAPTNANAFNITAGTATKLGYAPQPGGGTGGTAWTNQPVVAIQDANGNTVTTATNTPITLAILNNAGPGGTLTCTTNPVTTSSGSATFAGCKIDKAGNGYTIRATGGAFTQADSNGFNITAGTLASFTVSNPGTQVAGTAFNVTVTAIDAGGNPASGWTTATNCITFSGPANSPLGNVPTYPAPGACGAGNSSLSFNASGQATASITLFKALAATTLTVKDSPGATHSGSATFAVDSKGVTLAFSPALPTTVPKNGNRGFTITVPTDQYGNTFTSAAGVAVTVTLTPTNGTWGFTSTTSASQTSTIVTITTGPATNTFTVFENNSTNGRTATLSASTSAVGFTAPGSGTLTSSP